MNLLTAQPWPGNVREFGNVIQRLVVLLPRQTLSAQDIIPLIIAETGPKQSASNGQSLKAARDEFERKAHPQGAGRLPREHDRSRPPPRHRQGHPLPHPGAPRRQAGRRLTANSRPWIAAARLPLLFAPLLRQRNTSRCAHATQTRPCDRPWAAPSRPTSECQRQPPLARMLLLPVPMVHVKLDSGNGRESVPHPAAPSQARERRRLLVRTALQQGVTCVGSS